MPETKPAPLSQSLGAALPPTIRHMMETLFAQSFADVRVHVGHEATLARASAYTQGNDIHFAPGEYQPFTAQGRRLLGHELSHVIPAECRWKNIHPEHDRSGTPARTVVTTWA